MGWAEALTLPGPEFFALAMRLPVYPGVIHFRAIEEERKANRNVKHGSKVIESEPRAIAADPLMADLIEFA